MEENVVHLKNLPLHMPVFICTPQALICTPQGKKIPSRPHLYPPPPLIYSTTIENVIALLMPMMSYNYLIWVGRSPARLISFFRPSVQNFSGEPPLGDLIYQHLTSFTHICQKCHMVVDSGFACITGCSLYLHMFTMLQKYHSLPLALLCMFLTSADCCECRSNWFNICCTQVNTYPPIACDGA